MFRPAGQAVLRLQLHVRRAEDAADGAVAQCPALHPYYAGAQALHTQETSREQDETEAT